MLTRVELEAKNKEHYISGKMFVLNNGAEVVIPSMPIGTISAKFIRMREAMGEPESVSKKGDDGKPIFNTDGVPEMVPNPRFIDSSSEKGMEFFGKMLHRILALNYDITEEQADGLFSMNHFDKIVTWFFTGRDDADLSRRMTELERATVPTATGANGTAPGDRPAIDSKPRAKELLA